MMMCNFLEEASWGVLLCLLEHQIYLFLEILRYRNQEQSVETKLRKFVI